MGSKKVLSHYRGKNDQELKVSIIKQLHVTLMTLGILCKAWGSATPACLMESDYDIQSCKLILGVQESYMKSLD